MRSARTLVPVLVSLAAALGPPAAVAVPPPLEPLDKQNWIWQGEMNWSQYTPLPGRDYSDPSIQPSVKRWKVALVVVDYPNRSFIVSEPARSTIWAPPPTPRIPCRARTCPSSTATSSTRRARSTTSRP